MVAALAAEGAGGGSWCWSVTPCRAGDGALLRPHSSLRDGRPKSAASATATMAADILAKAHGETDAAMVAHLCRQSTVTIDWLNEHHGLDLDVIDSFLYPGHSAHRMHGTPSRTGGELIGTLDAGGGGGGGADCHRRPCDRAVRRKRRESPRRALQPPRRRQEDLAAAP